MQEKNNIRFFFSIALKKTQPLIYLVLGWLTTPLRLQKTLRVCTVWENQEKIQSIGVPALVDHSVVEASWCQGSQGTVEIPYLQDPCHPIGHIEEIQGVETQGLTLPVPVLKNLTLPWVSNTLQSYPSTEVHLAHFRCVTEIPRMLTPFWNKSVQPHRPCYSSVKGAVPLANDYSAGKKREDDNLLIIHTTFCISLNLYLNLNDTVCSFIFCF